MNTPLLVLVHGWSFGPGMWEEVTRALPGVECLAVDLARSPPDALAPSGRMVVAVGHSLGVLWLLARASMRFDALVSINGFPRFLEADDYRPAVRPAALARLRRRLVADPGAALAEFRASVGAPPMAEPVDRTALLEQLDALAQWDGRERLATVADRTWVLAGAEDAIVPLAMSRQAFAAVAPERWTADPRPGHVLPLSDPALCAGIIRRAMETM